MTDQPDDMSGHCAKVNNDTDHLHLWSMHWCGDKLPFVCQRLACLQGVWLTYLSCDLLPSNKVHRAIKLDTICGVYYKDNQSFIKLNCCTLVKVLSVPCLKL